MRVKSNQRYKRFMTNKLRITREERSWILYDVGNSAFVLVMVTAIMPLFFKEFAAAGQPDAVATANWGFANSAASLILALLAPILGALADYRDRKKIFFTTFLFFGLLFTLGLPFIQQGQWVLCLLLFIGARVGWAGANIFYDAFLTDVTSPKRMDSISARGFAWGYIGSVIPFLAIIGLILHATDDTGGLPAQETKIGFIIVALWWLLLSVPALKHLRQTHYLPPVAAPVTDSLRRLARTFRQIRRHRQIFLFLSAYFFYIDGVGTIISMSTAYGSDLGFGPTMLIVMLLFIQVVAFPCTLLYGRLAKYFSTKTMLLAGISVYTLVTLLAFFLPAIHNLFWKTATFWCIAFLVASSMGGIQALSRSYYGKLLPAKQSAEFFGFYNVFGKFAAISGPFLMGLVGRLTGDTRWGVLCILALFVIGGLLLKQIEEPPE